MERHIVIAHEGEEIAASIHYPAPDKKQAEGRCKKSCTTRHYLSWICRQSGGSESFICGDG